MPLTHNPTANLVREQVQSTAATSSAVPDGGGFFNGMNFNGFDPSNLIPSLSTLGLTAGVGLGTYGIQAASRLRLNTLLGGKHTADDHAIAIARSARTTLYSVGGPLFGATISSGIGNLIANQFDPENKNKVLQYGATITGGVVGGTLGYMANTAISMINGAHLAYELTGNIQDTVGTTRSKIVQILSMIPGVGVGLLASAGGPLGTLAMNAIGFNVSDILKDRNEARDNAIAGTTRTGNMAMGTFMSDFDTQTNPAGQPLLWNGAAERATITANIDNFLGRLTDSATDDATREKLFITLKKFVPVRYKEASQIPNGMTTERLLQEASKNIVSLRAKKREKNASQEEIDALPNLEAIMRGLFGLHNAVSSGLALSEDQIQENMIGGTTPWTTNRTIRIAVLQNEKVKDFLANEFSVSEMQTIWQGVDKKAKYNANLDKILARMTGTGYEAIKRTIQREIKENDEAFMKANLSRIISLIPSSSRASLVVRRIPILGGSISDAEIEKNYKDNPLGLYQKLSIGAKNSFFGVDTSGAITSPPSSHAVPLPSNKDIKTHFEGNGEELFNHLTAPDKITFLNDITPSTEDKMLEEFKKLNPLDYWNDLTTTRQDNFLQSIQDNDASLEFVVRENVLNTQSTNPSFRPNSSGGVFERNSKEIAEIFYPETPEANDEVKLNMQNIKGKFMEMLPWIITAKDTLETVLPLFRKKQPQNS